MTETELQEIEKRCGKASGGEWTSELARWDISSKRYQVVCNGSPICTMPTEGPGSRRNAAFIAHARQDIPALLSTVRELQRQVQERDKEIKRLIDEMTVLHESARPDDGPDQDAIIPARAFGQFVNAHADALRFYAHPESYRDQHDESDGTTYKDVLADGGRIARDAIAANHMSEDKHDEMAREIADQYWGNANPFWNRKGDFEFAIASALRQVERETLAQIDIERLAALEHEQWAHWTKYMLGNLTADNIVRWRRQIDTGYSDLSESEKESDRNWAYRVIRALSPTANELSTTQELADVSTEGGLINPWQPIETAPKDGTTVDLWLPELGRYADCAWGRPPHCCGEMGEYCDSEWHFMEDGWYDTTFGQQLSEMPTHWMPQPTGPIQAAEKGE